jgi:hypothetical protein
MPRGTPPVTPSCLGGRTIKNGNGPRTYALRVAGAASAVIRCCSRPVHLRMHASTRERCLGCSLGCSTDLENGRDRRRVRPRRDPICRDWLCDEEQGGFGTVITVITGDAVGANYPPATTCSCWPTSSTTIRPPSTPSRPAGLGSPAGSGPPLLGRLLDQPGPHRAAACCANGW